MGTANAAAMTDDGSCFDQHEAMKAVPNAWLAMPLVGHQTMHMDATGPREVIELRNCLSCGSTLAKQISAGDYATAESLGLTSDVSILTIDALRLGQQLRMQARTAPSRDLREFLDRMGTTFVSAAMLQLKMAAKS